MNFNNFTIKAQQAVQQAQEVAEGNQNQSIEIAHLLKGILSVDENVVPFLLKKMSVDVNQFERGLDEIISSLPKVTGGSPYLSNNINKALQRSLGLLKEFNDEFVSIEIILLSIISVDDKATTLLKNLGITEKGIRMAIHELRKGTSANNPTAEDTYNALNKYARNLNELARSNKLDPVIGRDEEIRRVLQILSRRTKNNPILIG